MSDKCSPTSTHSKLNNNDDLSETKVKVNKKKKKKVVYSKGVETMFRNAYRAQLDLISLAATKANIMISLNGFIVSILMVSGSVFFENSAAFIIPMVIFLLTSVSSIYFALSSASPENTRKHKRLIPCLTALIKGDISIRDFADFRRLPQKSFDRQNSNILIFEDYAKVPKDIYLDCMDELIKDQDKLYQKMSDQLYYLGKYADNKFRTLGYSYSIFRWGLILSIIVFIAIKSFHYFLPHQSVVSTEIIGSSETHTFDDIYEPSGIQALPDGRIVVIEDEASIALHILKPESNNTFTENKALSHKLRKSFNIRLNDLEAITIGPDGYIYAMTSHQRDLSGDRKTNRELFIRFKISKNDIVDIGIYKNLYLDIEKADILGEIDEQGNGGIYNINIEALSFNQNGELMVGFRTPLKGEDTIIGVIKNPIEIFTQNAQAQFENQPILMDLHGGGIRAMSYDPVLKGYLISNEVFGIGKNRSKKFSQLLFWDGDKEHRVQHINKPGIKNIESITSVTIGGVNKILIAGDDGKKINNRPASYMLLEYGDLTEK